MPVINATIMDGKNTTKPSIPRLPWLIRTKRSKAEPISIKIDRYGRPNRRNAPNKPKSGLSVLPVPGRGQIERYTLNKAVLTIPRIAVIRDGFSSSLQVERNES